MRTIQFLLKKEFVQIVRNKAMLPILVIAPIIQLLILAHAASFEIKNLKVHVIDLDQSPFSRLLINKFQGSDHFELANFSFSHKIAEDDFLKDKVNLVVKIPANFEGDLINENKAKVQFIINAINGNAAGLTFVYASSILKDFNTQIMGEWINEKTFGPAAYNINYSFWFNPEMNYKTFMVPGILVMLVTMIGMLLTGMNIVREKETGTIEQINVTPIRKIHFIIGKLLPFWMIALFELAFGLLIAKLVFDIPIVGSIWLIFLFAGVYLLVVLAFWITGIDSYRYATTGNVHLLVLHGNIHTDEWFVYTY